MGASHDEKDKTMSNALAMDGMYYLGKVYGENPSINVVESIRYEEPFLDKADIPKLLEDCNKEVGRRGRDWSAAGEELQKEEPNTESPPTQAPKPSE
jgi:hypothetical protein